MLAISQAKGVKYISNGIRSRVSVRSISHWGWVVTVATFGILFFGIGFQLTFQSVMIIPISEEFHQPMGLSTMALSVFHLAFAFSFLAFPIGKKIGVRWAAIIGGVLAASGRITTAFAPSLWFVYAASLVSGLGSILLHYTALTLLNRYFRASDHLSVAMGFALCGQPAAILTTPLLLHWLTNIFDWRGTCLVCGTISLNMIVFAALLKPFEEDSVPTIHEPSPCRVQCSPPLSIKNPPPLTNGIAITAVAEYSIPDTSVPETIFEEDEEEDDEDEYGSCSVVESNGYSSHLSLSPQTESSVSSFTNHNSSQNSIEKSSFNPANMSPTLARYLAISQEPKNIFLRPEIKRARSHSIDGSTFASKDGFLCAPDFALPRAKSADDVKKPCDPRQNDSHRRSTLRDMLKGGASVFQRKDTFKNMAAAPFFSKRRDSVRAFSAVTVPETLMSSRVSLASKDHNQIVDQKETASWGFRLWVYGTATLLFRGAFSIVLCQLASSLQGHHRLKAVALVSFAGAGALAGRLTFGMVADWPRVDRLLLNAVSSGIAGTLSILRAGYSIQHYWLHASLTLAGAFFTATSFLMHSVHLNEMVADDPRLSLITALRAIDATQAAGFVTGPCAAGIILDVTESYRGALALSGICMLTGAILLLLLRITRSCISKSTSCNV